MIDRKEQDGDKEEFKECGCLLVEKHYAVNWRRSKTDDWKGMEKRDRGRYGTIKKKTDRSL